MLSKQKKTDFYLILSWTGLIFIKKLRKYFSGIKSIAYCEEAYTQSIRVRHKRLHDKLPTQRQWKSIDAKF